MIINSEILVSSEKPLSSNEISDILFDRGLVVTECNVLSTTKKGNETFYKCYITIDLRMTFSVCSNDVIIDPLTFDVQL